MAGYVINGSLDYAEIFPCICTKPFIPYIYIFIFVRQLFFYGNGLFVVLRDHLYDATKQEMCVSDKSLVNEYQVFL